MYNIIVLILIILSISDVFINGFHFINIYGVYVCLAHHPMHSYYLILIPYKTGIMSILQSHYNLEMVSISKLVSNESALSPTNA